MHGKDTANKALLGPSKTYMIEVFKLLARNYVHLNVPSWMFGMVLNRPLSYYDSICYSGPAKRVSK